ncbi:MAG TPA: ImmA/IrrE family metallo-endopeptidase [Solirubrobacteraceae bacterium]|jgi:Zn-dependent peptidase ImmA (M78 family)|nr:ImmA/IrrE family metallo-endopeptidase [Solirubrobacteraceae bacterium]
MSWSAAHREAIIAAADAREELELDSFERIDIFEALVQDGLKVVFRPLHGVAAFYEPPRQTASAGVLINSQHPLALQRYSAAHEYGHHVFNHGRQIERDSELGVKRGTMTQEERLAEAFAAWFLMPPEAARAALARLGIERPATPRDAYALGLRLGVSYKAVCTHLPSLKLASASAARAWAELALKAIKQELTGTPPPGGWQNDVWRLTGADGEAPLTARCGDRLLLNLPARAVKELPDGLAAHELPAQDLLSRPQLCIDLASDAVPGPRTFELTYDDAGPVQYTLLLERPLRGRYVSRKITP